MFSFIPLQYNFGLPRFIKYLCRIFFQIVNTQNTETKSRIEYDSTMVLQMMMTKALHLRNTISGISYESNNGNRLNKIIDPTVVASLIRNIYETTGMFNLIYRTTTDPEEKK